MKSLCFHVLFLMFFFLSFAAKANLSIRDVDNFIDKMVPKKCTQERKTLCNHLKVFRDGSDFDFKDDVILIGDTYTGHMDFRQTLEYPHHRSFLIVKKNKKEISSHFGKFEIENDKEKKEVEIFVENTKQKKSVKSLSLYKFLKSHQSTLPFFNCKKIQKTYSCQNSNQPNQSFFIRKNNNAIYVFAIGRVPFMKNSFDTITGFIVSKIEY